MTAIALKDFSWERMVAAVEDVRERACRAAAALRNAGISFVVIGGHAVAAWVARVDKEAVRNTKDVDILIRRQDLAKATEVLEAAGFVHHNVSGIDLFLDGPEGSVRSALHIVFAGEVLNSDCAVASPPVTESEVGPDFPVPTLDALLNMKLIAFRLKDQLHLMDLLDVGLIDESWCAKVPKELVARLLEVIEKRKKEI